MAVEEPPFHVVLRDGAFEVRDYPELVVAEVTVAGEQHQAASGGFRLLAGYIFGGNRGRRSIPMTAPVTQTPLGAGIAAGTPVVETRAAGGWIVRFTMPRRYALETLPEPQDPRVRLRRAPPCRIATLRFSGLAQAGEVRSRGVELDAWIRTHRLRPVGPVSLAQYDPPWTLWFLRRNEVMVPVAA